MILNVALAAASSNDRVEYFWASHMDAVDAFTAAQTPISTVFAVCIFFYGIVGTLWFLFSRLSKETENYEMFRIGLNCSTYAACAITMHMLNKSLATTLQEPSLISVAQMVVAVAFFVTIAGKQLLDADRNALLTWCVVPSFFAAILISSFYTYEFISLSMLTIMRNLTPLVVLPFETIFMPPESRPVTNAAIIGSMVCMLLGAILYGGALEVSIAGVFFACLNMVIAVFDRIIQRRLLTDHCKTLPSSVCSIMNNGLACIPALILAGFAGEMKQATSTEMSQNWTDPIVLIVLGISGFVGMGVGYFGMEAQRDISATSLFVLQNTSKIGVVALGIMVFGDPIKSGIANLGLVMSLVGSLAYGHSTMKIKADAEAEKAKLVKADEKA
jgi:drug/metabolite transporter (DMT)-like permease